MTSSSYNPSPEDFERAFSGRQKSDSGQNQRFGRRPFKPRLNLYEDAQKNLVTASLELPGLEKNDVQISIHNGRLMVVGQTKKPIGDETGYVIRERRFGRFQRVLQLPPGVKEEQIKASMKDGILNITFPKTTARIAVS